MKMNKEEQSLEQVILDDLKNKKAEIINSSKVDKPISFKQIPDNLENIKKSFWDNFKIDWDSLVINQMNPVLETAKINYWIPEDTLKAIQEQKDGKTSIYFVSTFKSIWDAFILPHALTNEKRFNKFWNVYKKQSNPKYTYKKSTDIDMPYVMMNSALTSYVGFIKSFLEKKLKENSRILLIDKNISPMNYRNVLRNIEDVLSNNEILLTFPEGSRSRTGVAQEFDKSLFIGAINASKDSNVKIIPLNIDYSGVLEMSHLVNGTNYFQMLYSGIVNRRKMKFGRIYLTMGRPIDLKPDMLLPGENLESLNSLKLTDRKKADLSYRLANYTRDASLNLVKIQPINVVAEAILRINPGNSRTIHTDEPEFVNAIISTMYDLDNHQHKFRRFDKLSLIPDIVKKSKIHAMMDRYNLNYSDNEIVLNNQMLKELKVYCNYTKHYISKSDVYTKFVKPIVFGRRI
jgi:hypothetical protein